MPNATGYTGADVKRAKLNSDREMDAKVRDIARRAGSTRDNAVIVRHVKPWSLKPPPAKRGKR
jgi:hypothetical protein